MLNAKRRTFKPAVMPPMGITHVPVQPPVLGIHPGGIHLQVLRPNIVSPAQFGRLRANLPK